MESEDPQVGDEARYAWAQGRRSIRSVRQRMSELARQGSPITDEDVRNNNDDLSVLWRILDDATVGHLEPEPGAESEGPLRLGCDSYSDGSPVAALWPFPGSDANESPDDLLEGDIGDYRTPPGWEVVVIVPPHRRGTSER